LAKPVNRTNLSSCMASLLSKAALLEPGRRHKLSASVPDAQCSVEAGSRHRMRSCVSGPLEWCEALCAMGGHGDATERMASRSRDHLVILLTLGRPPRQRPRWLWRRNCSQRRDSSGAASPPLSRPTCAPPGVSVRPVPLDSPTVPRVCRGGV